MQLAAEVGLALHLSPPIRGQPGLPPHRRRRPIPLRTLAGCSSTPLLPSLLAHSHLQLRQCMRVYTLIVPYRLTVQQDMVM